jgi:hypothetical protein
MKPLLSSPLHFIASNSVMLLSINDGSGKTYTTPADYKRDQNSIIVLARKERGWWKNLRGGVSVTARICGQNLSGIADVAKLDKGALFETVKWMHPTMPAQQIADMLPELVVIQIHLAVATVTA